MAHKEAVSQLSILVNHLEQNIYPENGWTFDPTYFLGRKCIWSVFNADEKNKRGIIPTRWLEARRISSFKYEKQDDGEFFNAFWTKSQWNQIVNCRQKLELYFKNKHEELHALVWETRHPVSTAETLHEIPHSTNRPTNEEISETQEIVDIDHIEPLCVAEQNESDACTAHVNGPATSPQSPNNSTNSNTLTQMMQAMMEYQSKKQIDEKAQLFEFFAQSQTALLTHTAEENEKTRKLISGILGHLGKRTQPSFDEPLPTKYVRTEEEETEGLPLHL